MISPRRVKIKIGCAIVARDLARFSGGRHESDHELADTFIRTRLAQGQKKDVFRARFTQGDQGTTQSGIVLELVALNTIRGKQQDRDFTRDAQSLAGRRPVPGSRLGIHPIRDDPTFDHSGARIDCVTRSNSHLQGVAI